MKKIISASRRTDMVAFFPEHISQILADEKASVLGPSGHSYEVDLSPEMVHTIVLWSKNFENLIQNRFRLRERLEKYRQLYLHFTITGMGGSFIEAGVADPEVVLHQLSDLSDLVGTPQRISVRFDPVVSWKEGVRTRSNLDFFGTMAPVLASLGIDTVRISFAQWYKKSKKRADKAGLAFFDPSAEEKKKQAASLVSTARRWNLSLFSCSQNFLADVEGIRPSSCIDGALLQAIHPDRENASRKKDKSQRTECGCTESIDVGSYTQACPHSCLYCYANPKI